MQCQKCGSGLYSFDSEIAIHLPGPKGSKKPHVFLFPMIAVCPECGLSEFMLGRSELQQLGIGCEEKKHKPAKHRGMWC